jgi:hypothetical protein
MLKKKSKKVFRKCVDGRKVSEGRELSQKTVRKKSSKKSLEMGIIYKLLEGWRENYESNA